MEKPHKYMTLDVGYLVALTLAPDTAPMRVYIGEIQSADEHGVRITLVDWPIGDPSPWDVFVPWANIQSALVATPTHDRENFAETAGNWQARMNDGQKYSVELSD